MKKIMIEESGEVQGIIFRLAIFVGLLLAITFFI